MCVRAGTVGHGTSRKSLIGRIYKNYMSFTRESSVEDAKKDLAARLNINESAIVEKWIKDREFPDMSLGAPADGEMSAQMISNGWEIELEAGDTTYEYRGDKYQLRLHNFEGKNYVIKG